MKSIFEYNAYHEVLNRLDKLSPDSQARWGKMNINQMLKHCQKPIKLAFGEEKVKRPNILMRLMIKLMKPTLYNDKLWKQGLPTAKSFVIKNEQGFDNEKSKLSLLIERMHNSKSYFEPSRTHPIFGEMKYWMWGQSAYKHLDHHFRQFGV
ncbi:MAG: DUF1569 domain-containing protein [Bacteroidetes bacterium]|nr:DUF1569 domain-containing protein [Bacteroidota bacterium]